LFLDLQALEIGKAPSGTDGTGKKMTAAARITLNESRWVQLTFDSDAFNEMARDDFVTDLRERISKETQCGEEGGQSSS
jgi:hypothetical protein